MRAAGSALIRYGVAIAALAVAWGVRAMFTPLVGPEGLPFVFFYPAVVLAALVGGLGPAALAIAASAVIAHGMFFEAERSLMAADPAALISLLSYVFAAGCVAVTVEAMHRAHARAAGELERRVRSEASLRQRAEAQARAEESVAEFGRQQAALYAFTDRLYRAGTLAEVYAAALDAIQHALHRDRASILLADDAGVMRFVAWRGLSDAYRLAVDGHSPWRRDARNPQPIVVSDIAAADLEPALKAVVRAEGIGALCFIPLVVDGALIGKFMTYYDGPHPCSADEIALALSIARQLAFGVARKRTDRTLRETQERLLHREQALRHSAEEANRLKDEFLATLSHELRNPLHVMLNYAEVLSRWEHAHPAPELRQIAEVLKRSALAQSHLTGDLLDLSRLRSGKLTLSRETVRLRSAIDHAIETVRGEAARKRVALDVEVEPDLTVDGDALRIEQIVWNLLSNAVKFTPAGGRVSLRAFARDDGISIVVSDTGQGIETDFLPHVFEMFRQADASYSRPQRGLGIGLALVKQLVELHGGSITADSEGPGRGARFTVRLPPGRGGPATVAPHMDVRRGALHAMRVLVVDDSADTTAVVSQLLALDGASVVAANSGMEALERASGQRFDVVLSDISMPGMDGFEFVRRLRALPGCEHVPVLALTGFGRPEDLERARDEGFVSHLTKPVDVNLLVDLLRTLVMRNGEARAT
ncbi:MAG TPA: ATP-binding protein [Casimicrobiaceae bacterium]|jgi:signal transduction histidine kinase/ActR/RegA family two-component response regulator